MTPAYGGDWVLEAASKTGNAPIAGNPSTGQNPLHTQILEQWKLTC